jgi:hypothetical protein
LRFPKPSVDEAADRLFALVTDGIVRNISVGYRIDKVRVERSERVGEPERWFVERWTPHCESACKIDPLRRGIGVQN